MSDATEPSLSFTKARNGRAKILVVIGAPGTFDNILVGRIRQLPTVSQGLYDGVIEANGRGTAVCLRIDADASPEEVDDAVAWAVLMISHEITEYHGWDEHDYVLDPDEILWRRGAPLATRW